MIIQLLLSNTFYFAAIIFAAFVFFSCGLLYFDAFRASRTQRSPLLRSIGFLIISLMTLGQLLPLNQLLEQLANGLLFIGLLIILISLITEPILKKPALQLYSFTIPSINISSIGSVILAGFPFANALVMLVIGITYLVKTYKGLEKQLLLAGVAFIILSLAQLLDYLLLFSQTDNVVIAQLAAPYGIIWYIRYFLLLAGALILGYWTWGYMRFRIRIQLFTAILGITILVFVLATSFFTAILLRNIERETLTNLNTNGKVFYYTLERLQFEALSNARAVAGDSAIQNSINEDDSSQLFDLATRYYLDQGVDTLKITNVSGDVLVRAENKEKYGDSISSNLLFQSAVKGQKITTITSGEGVLNPDIRVEAAYPIKSNTDGRIIGVVMSGFSIDNAFVDGVKTVTGLDVSIYGSNQLAATTLLATDGASRLIGGAEKDKNIIDKVLSKGEVYIGPHAVLNQPFYASYLPLKTIGGKVIGMLFIGQPQTNLLNTAEKSIASTYIGSVILLLIFIFPVFIFSRFLDEHLRA